MFQCLVVLSFSKKDRVGTGQVSGPLTSDSQNIRELGMTRNPGSQETKEPVKDPALNCRFFVSSFMKLTGFFENFQKIPELEVLSFSKSFHHKPGIGGSLNSEDFQNLQFSIARNQRFFDPEDFQKVELEVYNKIQTTDQHWFVL